VPDLPVLASIHRSLHLGISLHQESGAIAHLGYGSQFGEVPDNGSEHVLSLLKQWGEIDSLEAPVEEISTRRALSGVLAVDTQEKSIVRTYMDPEMRRNGGKGDLPPEVEDPRLSSGY
jgi:hypothetical protein